MVSENEDAAYDWVLYPGTITTTTSPGGGGGGPAIDPQVMLRVSSDTRSRSLTQPTRSFGKVGEYGKRVIWRRLGQHRSFTPIITISSPVKRAIYTAYVDVEPNDG